MKCYKCKAGTCRPWKGPMTLMGEEIVALGDRCAKCGEITSSLDDTHRNFQAACVAVVERGIRKGNELAIVRKQAGLKAVELAELLDVRPETVSRWERGEVEIPLWASVIVGGLFSHPRIFRQSLLAAAR